MAEDLDIRSARALHTVKMTWGAPELWTTSELVTPLTDFDRLYRLTTGVFGQRGYRGRDQPFPYARPYISEVHFGSPLWLKVIVPTVLIEANWGLPNLIELIKQALLIPSETSAARARNRRDRREAEVDEIVYDTRLRHPGDIDTTARFEQEAELLEAETRRLRAVYELQELREKMDPEVVERVSERFGASGVSGLLDVIRHAEHGPASPQDLEVHPVSEDEKFPKPPRQLSEPPRQLSQPD